MSTDTSLITFKAISNFTNDLSEVFSDSHRPLKLYAHLINKTTIAHDKAIEKHTEAFRRFCVDNRESIAEQNIQKMNNSYILYSKRVFIDMKEIFLRADSETHKIIWKHLLTISALVDPAGKARKLLKEQSEKKGGNEANFLTDIISKVENQVNPDSNPMEAVASIMQSGIFTDLIQGMGSGLQDGTLDLTKLMGTVQNMVTQIGESSGDTENGEQAMNMINNMMSGLNIGGENNSQDSMNMPDLTGMLGPMMSAMMGGNGLPNLSGMMNSSNNNIETLVNSQVENARIAGRLE